MRAAVLRAAPGPLVIEELTLDDFGPRDVVVRVAAAGLCHSDLHFMDGSLPWPLPAVMGHESAGVVEAVGADVSYVAVGDHVVTAPPWCGQCVACVTGRGYRCADVQSTRPGAPRSRLRDRTGAPIGQFADLGGFAERLLVHEHGVVRLPEQLPLDRACLLGCGVLTGFGAVVNTAAVPAGTTVAVIGCGGVGLNVVQAAALVGARRVIAVDRLPHKLQLAQQLGATDVVDAASQDPVEAVVELTGGGVDFAFEVVGAPATVSQAWEMLTTFGVATVVGALRAGDSVTLGSDGFKRERRIQGSSLGSARFRVDVPRLAELVLQGRVQLDPLISQRISLDEINTGYEQLLGGGVARSVVVF